MAFDFAQAERRWVKTLSLKLVQPERSRRPRQHLPTKRPRPSTAALRRSPSPSELGEEWAEPNPLHLRWGGSPPGAAGWWRGRPPTKKGPGFSPSPFPFTQGRKISRDRRSGRPERRIRTNRPVRHLHDGDGRHGRDGGRCGLRPRDHRRARRHDHRRHDVDHGHPRAGHDHHAVHAVRGPDDCPPVPHRFPDRRRASTGGPCRADRSRAP
ncbi:hypothetical protein QE379_000456 [Sphingomonas sp. SORGH_AS 879]|nr:hypothetical protein [Sphingomonas sp. SORGH_AS_0879]